MWQFPMVELPTPNHTVEEIVEHDYGIEIAKGPSIIEFKHVFSHLVWEMESFEADLIKGKRTSNYDVHGLQ